MKLAFVLIDRNVWRNASGIALVGYSLTATLLYRCDIGCLLFWSNRSVESIWNTTFVKASVTQAFVVMFGKVMVWLGSKRMWSGTEKLLHLLWHLPPATKMRLPLNKNPALFAVQRKCILSICNKNASSVFARKKSPAVFATKFTCSKNQVWNKFEREEKRYWDAGEVVVALWEWAEKLNLEIF